MDFFAFIRVVGILGYKRMIGGVLSSQRSNLSLESVPNIVFMRAHSPVVNPDLIIDIDTSKY
jgi:hypothetical protein